MPMLPVRRMILAAIFGAAAWLVCVFLGAILAETGLPIATTVGELLVRFAAAIGALVALWHFFAGGTT